MTELVGFLAQQPVRAVLDGELVALDADGKPDFPQRIAASVAACPPSTVRSSMFSRTAVVMTLRLIDAT